MSKLVASSSLVRKLFFRLLTHLRAKHHSHGLTVWAPLSTSAETALILDRLSNALDLLKTYAPARYSRAVRSLSGIIVFGTDSVRASYDPLEGLCRLAENFMLAPDTTSPAIASTLVHEATHGWLFDRGINYAEPIRYRVEQICIRASMFVAKRFPGGAEEVDLCRQQLAIEPSFFSDAGFLELDARRLRETGCPEWLVRAVIWIAKKRAA